MEVLKRKLEIVGITLHFGYPSNLKSLVTNSMKPESKSIVYQMECECGVIYNGETKVGIKKRMQQHEVLIENDQEHSPSEIVKYHHTTK